MIFNILYRSVVLCITRYALLVRTCVCVQNIIIRTKVSKTTTKSKFFRWFFAGEGGDWGTGEVGEDRYGRDGRDERDGREDRDCRDHRDSREIYVIPDLAVVPFVSIINFMSFYEFR